MHFWLCFSPFFLSDKFFYSPYSCAVFHGGKYKKNIFQGVEPGPGRKVVKTQLGYDLDKEQFTDILDQVLESNLATDHHLQRLYAKVAFGVDFKISDDGLKR